MVPTDEELEILIREKMRIAVTAINNTSSSTNDCSAAEAVYHLSKALVNIETLELYKEDK